MPSPNLAITHVAAAQNQKEVTINDAVDALDRAMTDVAAVTFTSGSATLSDAAFRSAVAFAPAAALDAPATLTVPQIRRVFLVINSDAAHAITVARGATAFAVAPGQTAVLCTDGTADGLFAAAGAGQSQPAIYDFGMTHMDTPAPGTLAGKVAIARAISIPADFANAVGNAEVPPATAGWGLDVTHNGSLIGTIQIGTAGAFSFSTQNGAPISVAAGDILRFVANAGNDPAEASLAGIAITIAAEIA